MTITVKQIRKLQEIAREDGRRGFERAFHKMYMHAVDNGCSGSMEFYGCYGSPEALLDLKICSPAQ